MTMSRLTYIPGFSVNSSHFEWRAGLSDTVLKGDHPRTIPAKFALIWFSGFRGEDLNVIFYQNTCCMSNLYRQSDITALVNMAAVLSLIVFYFLVVAPLCVEMKTVLDE
jgi:hypothetical protein